MKILVFGFTDNIGGIETMFMQYYLNLQDEQNHFDFVTIFDQIAFEEEITQNNSQVYKLTSPKKNPFKYKRQISEILKESDYDCVYVNMLSAANIAPLQIAKKFKIGKIVAHSHNANTPKGILRKALHLLNRKKINKIATIKIACSKKAGDWLFGKGQKYYLLDNLVDPKKFGYKKEQARQFKQNGDEYIVGHIGRFSEQKNQDFILDIAKNIKDSNIKFKLIGKGDDLARIQQRLVNESINNIEIISNIRTTENCYSGFDLFILPSKFEGLPVVGIEAQVNGLPCLFSDTITRELSLTNNCEYLPLAKTTWIKAIESKPMRANEPIKNDQNLSIHKNHVKLLKILEEKNG